MLGCDWDVFCPAQVSTASNVSAKGRIGLGLGLGLGPADRFPLLASRLREPGLMLRRGIGPKPSKLH